MSKSQITSQLTRVTVPQIGDANFVSGIHNAFEIIKNTGDQSMDCPKPFNAHHSTRSHDGEYTRNIAAFEAVTMLSPIITITNGDLLSAITPLNTWPSA